MTTILIIIGIVVLWLWILNQDNGISPNIKRPVNMGVLAIVTAWLLVELIRRWI